MPTLFILRRLANSVGGSPCLWRRRTQWVRGRAVNQRGIRQSYEEANRDAVPPAYFWKTRQELFGLIFLMLSLTLYASLSIFTGSFQLHHAIRAIRFSQSSYADLMKNFLLDCFLILTSIAHLHRHLARTPRKIGTLFSVKHMSRLFSQPTYIQAVWSRPEISGAFSSRRWNLVLSPFLFYQNSPYTQLRH